MEICGCGAEEFRRRRHVPVRLAEVDVTKIRREMSEPGLHIEAFLMPPSQSRYDKCVSQGMQGWFVAAVVRFDAGFADNQTKRLIQRCVR